MAELAILLAFVFGGTVGFFVGRGTAAERPQGTARGGQEPDNHPLA